MLKKFFIICQIVLLVMPTLMVNANEITEEAEIEDEKIFEIEYEYFENEEWKFKKEKVKYLTDENENKHIIYEVNSHIIDGTNLEYEENKKIKSVLELGFPTKSKEEMNLQNDIEAYMATKFALIWNLNDYDKEDLYVKIRDIEEKDENRNDETEENIEKKAETDNIENSEEEKIKTGNVDENAESSDIDRNLDVQKEITNIEEIVEEKKNKSNIISSGAESDQTVDNNENDNKNESAEITENLKIKNSIDASYKILTILEEEKVPEINEDKNNNDKNDEDEKPQEEPKDEEKEENIELIPDIDLEVKSKNVISSNENMEYNIKIKNNGNTNIIDLGLFNNIDYEKSKIKKIYTGIFNKEIKFNVYYKTSESFEYVLLEEDLNSTINNVIDFEKISIKENIEEIKIDFKEIPEGFESIEDIKIITKINTLKNNENVQNYTILEGKFNGIKLSKEKENSANIYNLEEKRKLPKTGY